MKNHSLCMPYKVIPESIALKKCKKARKSRNVESFHEMRFLIYLKKKVQRNIPLLYKENKNAIFLHTELQKVKKRKSHKFEIILKHVII